MSQRFRKHQHLLKAVDFRRVYNRRASVGDHHLIVYGAANELGYSRIGLSVSRKVGNAVVRNWWKRRIRESFRLAQDSLPAGIDFVVIPRNRNRTDFRSISQSVESLCHRVQRKLNRKQAPR